MYLAYVYNKERKEIAFIGIKTHQNKSINLYHNEVSLKSVVSKNKNYNVYMKCCTAYKLLRYANGVQFKWWKFTLRENYIQPYFKNPASTKNLLSNSY